MPIIKTKAVVLNKRVLWEADRLYLLFTEDFGKINAQVKSAARSTSKMAGSLEPISIVEVMVIKGKKRETVAGVNLIKRFQYNNLAIFKEVSLVRELFVKFIKSESKEPKLYNNLVVYLMALEKIDQSSIPSLLKVRFITQRFIWQMIKILGFKPDLNNDNSLDNSLKQVLDSCLAANISSLQISLNLIKELENYTRKYLHNITERDLNSFYFMSYA